MYLEDLRHLEISGDVTFICNDGKVSYSLGLLSVLFPKMMEVLTEIHEPRQFCILDQVSREQL